MANDGKGKATKPALENPKSAGGCHHSDWSPCILIRTSSLSLCLPVLALGPVGVGSLDPHVAADVLKGDTIRAKLLMDWACTNVSIAGEGGSNKQLSTADKATKRRNKAYSEVWDLFSMSSTDVRALLPRAMLSWQSRELTEISLEKLSYSLFCLLVCRVGSKKSTGCVDVICACPPSVGRV